VTNTFPKLSSFKGNKKIFIILGAIVLIFFLIAYFVLPSARVVIKTESQNISIEENVIANTAVAALDADTLTVPAKTLDVVKDRSDTAVTTGTAKTGEKATGQIQLYNLTATEVTVPVSTELESIETGLKYTTTTTVKIPAKIPDDAPVNPGLIGSQPVGVTASSFGQEYNTDKKMQFRVKGFDIEKVYGKNFSNITGGTTTEKKVVSQTDYDTLKKKLEDQLKQDLLDGLKQTAGSERTLLEDTIKYETVNEDATPGINTEAENFSLSVSMKASALSFLKSDIDSLAKSLVEKRHKENVEVEKFEYTSKIVKTEGDKITIDLTITGIVRPSINTDDIKANLKGKNEGGAESYLSGNDQIKGFEIDLSPSWLPGFLKHFPNTVNRIKIEIVKE
jgi:hypothetical protein